MFVRHAESQDLFHVFQLCREAANRCRKNGKGYVAMQRSPAASMGFRLTATDSRPLGATYYNGNVKTTAQNVLYNLLEGPVAVDYTAAEVDSYLAKLERTGRSV